MRQIKFRGWDGRSMQPIVALHDNGIGALGDGGMVIPRDGHPDAVMQFTGLVNSRGVEIYEGDVLQDRYGKAAIVTWFNSTASFELLDVEEAVMNGLDSEEPAYIIDDSRGWVCLEVIGNIYQNPELLPRD